MGPTNVANVNIETALLTAKGSQILWRGKATYHVDLIPSLNPPLMRAAAPYPLILVLGIGIDNLMCYRQRRSKRKGFVQEPLVADARSQTAV